MDKKTVAPTHPIQSGANSGRFPPSIDARTVNNHFFETMEKIREKNREIAAARGGNVLIHSK